MSRRLRIILSLAGALTACGLVGFSLFGLAGREFAGALLLAVCAGIAHAVLCLRNGAKD